MSARKSEIRPLVIDLTMSISNRTAVYDIGEKLCELARPDFVRYWRLRLRRPVNFRTAGPLLSLVGKVLSRGVFWDTAKTWTPAWPRSKGRVLFVDPIFALKTRLGPNDIVVCHDVAPVSHPRYYDPGAGDTYAASYRSIQAARPGMVFDSEYTRRAFLELYPADYPMAEVVPLYFKPTLLSAAAPAVSPRTSPYFLMVGGMERRKNFRAAIEAFKLSGLAERGVELVMTGPRGNDSVEILPMIEATPGVVHLGYVGDEELVGLYRHAVALFFPSLVEGFGVPALEAPQVDLLPIVSRDTVLEEVVGPDGVFVDPESLEDMARTLNAVFAMSAEEKRGRLEKIRAYQEHFSMKNYRARWQALLGLDPDPA